MGVYLTCQFNVAVRTANPASGLVKLGLVTHTPQMTLRQGSEQERKLRLKKEPHGHPVSRKSDLILLYL